MKKAFEALVSLVQLALAILLIWMYIEVWINAWKEKKYIKFIIMSIIPAIIIHAVIEQEYKNSKYVLHHPVVNNPDLIRNK